MADRPNVRTPGECEDFPAALRVAAAETPVRGNLLIGAHIIALMRSYGVRTILTRDRDFRKFESIKAVDPFARQRA